MNYELLVLPILFLIISTIAYFKKEHNKMILLGILALFNAIFMEKFLTKRQKRINKLD